MSNGEKMTRSLEFSVDAKHTFKQKKICLDVPEVATVCFQDRQ